MNRNLIAGIIAAGILSVFPGAASAAWETKESPVNQVGTATTVSVSTFAWTAVPAATSLARRDLVCVSNAAGNTAPMYFIASPTASISVATTSWAYEVEKGESACLPIGPSLYLFGVSGHTAAENLRIQEWGQ